MSRGAAIEEDQRIRMKSPIAKVLLIFVGTFGVVVTTTYDLFRPGPARFGKMQFMGFIISILLLMAGLRSAFHSRKRQLDTLMLCIYLFGMLYLVLTPDSHFLDPDRRLLEVIAFFPVDFDFVVNILGFFPLGYLLLSLFHPDEGRCFSRCLVVVLSGVVLSLFIEVAQYYIPGRTSSMNDIVANGIGCAVGALYYHFEARIFGSSHRQLAR